MKPQIWSIPIVLFATAALFSFKASSQPFLTNGLVAFYPFNGNANDASGNGNHGAVTSAASAVDRFGNPSSAYAFDGVSSLITVPDSPSLRISNDITVTCWLRFAETNAQVRLLGKGGHCYKNYGLWYDPHGTDWLFQKFPPQGGCLGCQENTASVTPPLVLGTWYQMVGVRSGGVARLYVNGIQMQERSVCSSITYTGSESLLIGATDPADPPVDPPTSLVHGSLDDIRIYNRALSASEVLQLYNYESRSPFSPFLSLAINVTIFPQNTSNDNGVVTTTASPKPLLYATKDILNVLAYDENIAGNWASNSFPKGARLAIADDSFVVVNGTSVLLNVSDIMSLSVGENEIFSGVQNNATSLASHTPQKRQIAKITFNDTFIVGGKHFKFFLQGLLTRSTTDTTPVASIYTEMQTAKLTNAAGEGSSQNVPFVCSGSVTVSGRSPLSL